MIIVTDVKIVNVPDEQLHAVIHKMASPIFGLQDPFEPVPIQEEMIKGQWFRNKDGEMVAIGISKQAQDAIGIAFDGIEGLLKMNNYLRDQVNYCRDKAEGMENIIDKLGIELSSFKNMNFLQKLKYLFRRRSYYEK